MEIVLWILIVILGLVALYYRSKAREFESLFELSKEYGDEYKQWYSGKTTLYPPKYNKDGSIAKKRGRPPKANNKLVN